MAAMSIRGINRSSLPDSNTPNPFNRSGAATPRTYPEAFDSPQSSSDTGSSPNALSVSAAMELAKGALESVFVTIVGEVSELSNRPGYKAVYFSIKDERATLPCMMWLNRYRSAGAELRVGLKVEVTGRFTLYAAKGRMNFDVTSFTLAGEGRLRMEVAQLARRLEAQGLTAPGRKRPIPWLPQVIGIVTSPRGSVVHDMLRTLRRRYPLARVVVAGVPVEGQNAASAMMQGMKAVVDAGAEVVLLGRGGGSFEDLMPFNDERLAITISRCPVPVVTGVGHETDTTIADMVSDLRASTPTAAAEAVSPAPTELQDQLSAAGRALQRAMELQLEREGARLAQAASRPVLRDPNALLSQDAQALDYARERLARLLPNVTGRPREQLAGLALRIGRAIPGNVARDAQALALNAQRLERLLPTVTRQRREHLDNLGVRMARAIPVNVARDARSLDASRTRLKTLGTRLLDAYSPQVAAGKEELSQGMQSALREQGAELALAASRLNDLSPLTVLSRGYAIARKPDGVVVKQVGQVTPGQSLSVTVSDGVIDCIVEQAHPRVVNQG